MGVLDHVSDFFDCSGGGFSPKKRKHLQTVEVFVLLDCDGCERKVRRVVERMKDVKEFEVDRKTHKITVVGYVEPEKVAAKIANGTGKRAELWPFLPYDEVAHPYAQGVYDRRAPPGFVRNVEGNPEISHLARASSTEVRYITAFSDDNASACAVM